MTQINQITVPHSIFESEKSYTCQVRQLFNNAEYSKWSEVEFSTYYPTHDSIIGGNATLVSDNVIQGGDSITQTYDNTINGGSSIKFSSYPIQSGVFTLYPDPDIVDNEPFEAYVNMEIEGGGWVLAGTLANDGNNYWTWDNFHNWDRGNDYGTIANAFQHDYQHKKVWTTIKANQILLAVNNSPNKYLVIDSILNDQTMASRWPSSTTNTGRYYVSKSVGSWWYQCGLGFALCHNDSDGYGNTWAVGFVAFAKNNHNCYFDDNTGGFNTHNNSDWEGYRTSDFWGQNVPYGSVMNIYIR